MRLSGEIIAFLGATHMRGTFWPVVLIIVGGLLLLSNLGILPLGELKALVGTWWPLILILIGVTSLLKKGR